MNPGKLDRRVEIWGQVPYENELGEDDFTNAKIKTVWASIIPQTGSLIKQQNVGTLLSNVTHKIIMRYSSAKNLTTANWLMYFEKDADRQIYLNDQTKKVGHRFDIKYILDPNFSHETVEIFVEEIIE